MTSSSSSSPEIHGADAQDRPFSYKLATHEEVLDDLSSRFILNLPDDELSSLERICFQVEQAHWFYEDFIREENPKFPSLPLKKFSEMLFQACPLLHQWSHDHELAYTTFMQYKTRVPVCGAIMLNDTWEKCVLVKGWKSSSGWGFPKGKINQVEPPANCAIREVLEETGYNLAGQLNPDHLIEMSIREQKISLFIVPGVPEDYPFKTKTRKEISKIEWFRLADLPTWKRNKTAAGRFYLISPFIGPLKAFINANKPRAPRKTPKSKKAQPTLSHTAQTQSKEVILDSGLQPSSIEDGEPHTPSPHHPGSYPNSASYGTDKDSAAVKMDPHFANLLSGLAISASSAADSKPTSAVATSRAYTIKEPPDIVVPPSLKEDRSATASLLQDTPSASTLIAPLDSVGRPPLAQSIPHISSLPSSTNATTVSPVESNAKVTIPVAQSIASQTTPQTLGTSAQASSQAVSTPDRSLSEQHIALLDAVSKEAAMLQEAYKTAAANGIPINVNDNFKHPILAAPAPPPSFSPRTMYSQADTFKYPALDGSAPPSFRPQHIADTYTFSPSQPSGYHASGTHHLGNMYTPYQERPRTSFAYHRSPLNATLSGSASMNQSQLLALMNGPSVNSPIPYSGHSVPPSIQNPPLPPFHTQNSGQRLPFHTPRFPPAPAALPYAPVAASHLPAQPLPPVNNALLSILNSGRSTSRFSNLSPYSSTPIIRE
ncbi:hypothetical protein DXG01_000219 [Tephrocybe rancida]|nr:hypothetical protein DXG01_000219 [Tephrocybe rancida]